MQFFEIILASSLFRTSPSDQDVDEYHSFSLLSFDKDTFFVPP